MGVALVPGLPDQLSRPRRASPGGPRALLTGHPSGITRTVVRSRASNGAPFVPFEARRFGRTARRLMDANAYCPRFLREGGASETAPVPERGRPIPVSVLD